MTGVELISLIRRATLKDKNIPYKWDDDVLMLFLNEAEREACRRSPLLIDDTTASDSNSLPISYVVIVGGTSEYSLSPKVKRILKCVPSAGNSVPLEQVTEDFLDEYFPVWRTDTGAPIYYVQKNNKIRLVPEPIANDAQAVSGITRVSTVATVSLPSHGYADQKTVAIAGADQAEYNETAVITKIDDDSFSYTVTGTPATPATGTITATLIDTLAMEVVRLPLADMTINGAESPEIGEDDHLSLIDWVAHLALLDHDQEKEKMRRSLLHEQVFTQKFGPKISAITESNRKRRARNKSLRPKSFGFT